MHFSLGTDSRLLNFTDFNGNYTSFGAGITIAVVGDERKDLVAAFLAKGSVKPQSNISFPAIPRKRAPGCLPGKPACKDISLRSNLQD